MRDAWYQNAFIYGLDVRRFQDSNGDGYGDLPGLTSRLDYLAGLGVQALWLLPCLDTPLRDNGYDVRDYLRIDPRVGTLEDFTRLAAEAHARGIRLIFDLVVNHTSDEHPWFQASRRDPQSMYREYYVWAPAPQPELPEVEPAFPGEDDQVWTRDELSGLYYFHRFYRFQPDLLVENPAVQEEIRRIMDFWLALGVDGFRFDAAAVMIQPKGLKTNKFKHPFAIFRDFHQFVRQRVPDGVLLGEANAPLDEIYRFFGNGHELNLLFNFIGNAHIFLALAQQRAEPLKDLLRGGRMPPAKCGWVNFLRNLDELNLNRLPGPQLDQVMAAFAPDPDMRLYGRGIRRRVAPMLGGDRRRMELAYSLMFSLPGSPMLVYGDELGMGDDLSQLGREAARAPMQWSAEKNAGFSSSDALIAPVVSGGPFDYRQINVAAEQADPGSFLNWVKQLAAVRRECPQIGQQPAEVIELANDEAHVLAHAYAHPEENRAGVPLYLFHNLDGRPHQVTLALEPQIAGRLKPCLGNGQAEAAEGGLQVSLPAWGYLWLKVR